MSVVGQLFFSGPRPWQLVPKEGRRRGGRSGSHQWLKEQLNSVISLGSDAMKHVVSLSLFMLTVTKDGFAQNSLLDFPKGFLCPLVISVYRYLTELTGQ